MRHSLPAVNETLGFLLVILGRNREGKKAPEVQVVYFGVCMHRGGLSVHRGVWRSRRAAGAQLLVELLS